MSSSFYISVLGTGADGGNSLLRVPRVLAILRKVARKGCRASCAGLFLWWSNSPNNYTV